MTRPSGGSALWRTGLAAVLCAALAACSTGTDPDEVPTRAPLPSVSTDADELATVTYGVFGTEEEIAAHQEVVDAYNEQALTVEVVLRSWPTAAAMMQAIAAGENVLDLYQVNRSQLADVIEQERNVPLFSLLEERDISYGDNYSLDTIEAFSLGDNLQCMPYGVSPMVMYINTGLVDFDRMRLLGLPAPEADDQMQWDIEQFGAAVRFATRPRLKTRGLSFDPSLEALAPYLYSGGGSIVDDPDDPQELELSSDDNQETLATVLALARDPLTTLSNLQLRRATPLEWFKRGRLGVLAGDRSLTPQLRDVPGLDFDVMLMPRIGRTVTTGDVTGICIAPGRDVQRAADFLVYAISAEGFVPVAEAGYVVPANTSVARSEVFLQPDQQPDSAGVFNAAVDSMELLPLPVDDPVLQSAVQPLVERLFTSTLPPDLEIATAVIDEVSRPILDPTYVPDPDADPDAPSVPSTPPSP